MLGLNRVKENKFDKFYTNKKVARECLDHVIETIDYSQFRTVIEPSAGSGSFSDLFPEYFPNLELFAFDIEPQGENIAQQDFLELDTANFQKPCLVIGNPPFGRQSSLAIKFIKKVCVFSTVFCFILPLSFKKESMISSIDRYFHLVFEKELEKNSFIVSEKEHDVPCVFQIWMKREKRREQKIKYIAKYFKFVKKDEDPDFAFRRVGGNTGKAMIRYKDCSIQSHYFIKLLNEEDNQKTVDRIVDKCNEFDWSEYSEKTAGPKSLSKQEISYNIDSFITNNDE